MAKLMTTARSRKRPTRTLAVFLEALDGDIVDIELKNDVVIRGMMDGVDHFSNIYLQNVTSLHPDGSVSSCEMMAVNGGAVRFIHIPRGSNPAARISKYLHRLEQYRKTYRSMRTGRIEKPGTDAREAAAAAGE